MILQKYKIKQKYQNTKSKKKYNIKNPKRCYLFCCCCWCCRVPLQVRSKKRPAPRSLPVHAPPESPTTPLPQGRGSTGCSALALHSCAPPAPPAGWTITIDFRPPRQLSRFGGGKCIYYVRQSRYYPVWGLTLNTEMVIPACSPPRWGAM